MPFRLVLGSLIFTTLMFGKIPYAHSDFISPSRYYTIDKIETHEIPSSNIETLEPGLDLESATPAPLDDSGVSIDDIVNLGKEIWSIVEANKPVAHIETDNASAMPKGIKDWTMMAGWRAPQAHTYQTTFTNLYGSNVVQFSYRITFVPGGSYRGAGHYLENITVEPSDLYVAWGYKFNAQVTIPSITNAGTIKSPTAAAEVLVKWQIDTILTHSEESAEYYVRGDGEFTAL